MGGGTGGNGGDVGGKSEMGVEGYAEDLGSFSKYIHHHINL